MLQSMGSQRVRHVTEQQGVEIQREPKDSRLAYGAPSSGSSSPEGEAGVTPVPREVGSVQLWFLDLCF